MRASPGTIVVPSFDFEARVAAVFSGIQIEERHGRRNCPKYTIKQFPSAEILRFQARGGVKSVHKPQLSNRMRCRWQVFDAGWVNLGKMVRPVCIGLFFCFSKVVRSRLFMN